MVGTAKTPVNVMSRVARPAAPVASMPQKMPPRTLEAISIAVTASPKSASSVCGRCRSPSVR